VAGLFTPDPGLVSLAAYTAHASQEKPGFGRIETPPPLFIATL